MNSLFTFFCTLMIMLMFSQIQAQDLSQYRGYKKLQGTKTGFFHVEKVNERWWIIDPEGYVFISFCLNHVVLHNSGSVDLLQDYNREKNISTFGEPGNIQDRKSFNKSQFVKNFKKMVADDYNELGFNTYGFSPLEYRPPNVAYTVGLIRYLPFSYWMKPDRINYPDVFSDEWKKHIEKVIIGEWEIERIKDDPWFLGYWFADCPIYTRKAADENKGNIYDNPRPAVLTWQESLKTSDKDSPAKRIFIDLVEERYNGNINRFNRVYGTRCTRFEDIHSLGEELLSPKREYEASLDDEDFLRLIIREYYKTMRGIIRKYDTNHLILGDRINGNAGPSLTALSEIKNWVDIIMLQFYGFYRDQKEAIEMVYGTTRRPILLCDSCFSFPLPKMTNPFGPQLGSQAERGKAYREYAEQVFSLPYIVGWHWCGYIDNYDTAEPGMQHSGIKNIYGELYTDLTDVMKEVNKGIYYKILK